MRGADLRRAVLVDAVLDNVRLEGCQLEGTIVSPGAIDIFEGWTAVELGPNEFTLTKGTKVDDLNTRHLSSTN